MQHVVIVDDLKPGMVIMIQNKQYLKITKIVTPRGASNMRLITGEFNGKCSNDGIIFNDAHIATIYLNIKDHVHIIDN